MKNFNLHPTSIIRITSKLNNNNEGADGSTAVSTAVFIAGRVNEAVFSIPIAIAIIYIALAAVSLWPII